MKLSPLVKAYRTSIKMLGIKKFTMHQLILKTLSRVPRGPASSQHLCRIAVHYRDWGKLPSLAGPESAEPRGLGHHPFLTHRGRKAWQLTPPHTLKEDS